MTETVRLPLDEARALAVQALSHAGLSAEHCEALADTIMAGQIDECHSHGLYRVLSCVDALRKGQVNVAAVPEVMDQAPGIVRVDAKNGFSPLAFRLGLPLLQEKARTQGIAALAINNCYHFSALWPEVERIAAAGLAALAMTPSHSWVAPAGGTKPVFGTNPIAFSWPRPGPFPFVFDFATSASARGEIELHRRAGKAIPEGWAIDSDGAPTTDAEAAMAGAMLTFGGHKGSALSAMVELMAGPLIGDLTSRESQIYDAGAGVTPCHGELLLAFDPNLLSGGRVAENAERAEALFDAIIGQGARLPSQRRYEARQRSEAAGSIEIPKRLHDDLLALLA
ncbi:Ldh family oxidoreductase [Rhizobium sp. NFR03]|uniref:Ldh family oxidoreductase n=1 Tax=Rhizobium sp. NFR03 TaxID=1566263 RepID=UPI0008B0A161|nr:Ldh family oxidoreductase [Rhizobium sp. NFR03]SES34332.1 Malate/lactate/ureidoglycolate dehydrogenase, LDH2 family [Rhizobium sp. NFR03]